MAKKQIAGSKAWTDEEMKEMRKLVKQNTPTGLIAHKLSRSEGAVRSKAAREGISLQPSNRSPYGRVS